MDIQDRRVKRTQQLLAKALIALTLEKGYDAVTIRDITERADIGYATFFRHYHHKDALLQEVSEVVMAELKNLLPAAPDGDAVVIGTTLFQYVQENNNIIRVLLSSRSSSSLVQHIIDIATQEVSNENTPLEGSAVPIEIAAYHLVNATIALIQWWLDHEMPYAPERMGIIFQELIIQPTRSVAFSPISLDAENV